MKFVRFGSMSLQKQTHYKEPKPDMYPCSPPSKKGFFAFPAGYMDPFYLPLSRPPEHPHSLKQYLRDENGAKLTRNDMFHKIYVDPERVERYVKAMLEVRVDGKLLYENLPEPEREEACREFVIKKFREEDGDADSYGRVLSPRGQEILKKRKLKKTQILWVKRPSYVMVRPDPEKDLTFYGLGTDKEDRSRLNQKLNYLLDPGGEKMEADDLFYADFRERFPDDYEGGYTPPKPDDDYDDRKELYYPDGKTILITKWLKKNHIKPEQLCIWPCYAEGDDEYAAILKKYRVFDYDGCLWHHLGMFLKPSEILSRFSDTWVYTDMHAYERALRQSNGNEFKKNMKYQRQMTRPGYFGAYTYNGTFDLSSMYEVFFDEKIS